MAGSATVKQAWNNSKGSAIVFASLNEIMAQQIQETVDVDDEREREELQRALDESRLLFEIESSGIEQDCSRDYELACLYASEKNEPDCSRDFEFAEKLQREYDRGEKIQAELERSRRECGVAKAILTSDSYRYQQKEDEDNNGSENEQSDGDETRNKLTEDEKRNAFPPCGFIRTSHGELVTKHDREFNERKNFVKAMQMPLNFVTEDMTDGRLSDRVLNNLRSCTKVEANRRCRVKDKEEKATSSSALDDGTRLTLLKWSNAGAFDRIEGVIAVGKEAAVLHAVKDQNDRIANTTDSDKAGDESDDDNNENNSNNAVNKLTISGESTEQIALSSSFSSIFLPNARTSSTACSSTHYAVKVFNTSIAGFRNRSEYVQDDFRFKNSRRVMKIWVQKEFMNLQRLRKAKIMCPTPIQHKNNVLLMSLVGQKGIAAQKLKDVEFVDEAHKADAFRQVREIIDRMFNASNLVHGDLSEFNLLYDDVEARVYVIDVAQAMDTSHPRALNFLVRDMRNVLEFFGRIGTSDLPSVVELFNEITQIEMDPSKHLSAEVESFARENRNVTLRNDKSRPADMELRLYDAERADSSVSPARAFN